MEAPLDGGATGAVVAVPHLRPVDIGVERFAEAIVERDHQLGRRPPHTGRLEACRRHRDTVVTLASATMVVPMRFRKLAVVTFLAVAASTCSRGDRDLAVEQRSASTTASTATAET